MRKPTGPGQIRDDLDLPPALRKGITALLFNWDFDDATLKPEHQKWLQDNALPPLTISPNTRIALTGMASRIGDWNYNQGLSQRRVDAVKAFLLSKGVRMTQIQVKAVGESAAAAAKKKDGTDDPEDRAVAVDLIGPPRRGPVHFRRFNPFDRLDGFNQVGDPQWLALPSLGPRRRLQLVNGEAVRLVVQDASVVQLVDPATNRLVDEIVVGEDFQPVEFQGMLPGDADIFGFDITGAFVCQLSVTSLLRKDVDVTFHKVSDKNNASTRSQATADTMIDECNRVYNRQANIFFKKKPIKPLPFPTEDLGNPVTPATTGTNFEKLTAKGDPKSRINIFFVWEWQRDAITTRDTDARADDIPGKNVVYEDDAGTDIGLTLAHEFGHCLGLSHTGTDDITDKTRLMWDFTDERGGLLVEDEIKTVNKGV